jgi:transcriptional regulator with XRE-family HTH domain
MRTRPYDNDLRKKVGSRLKLFRQSLGITQQEMAEKIGVGLQGTYNLYETGLRAMQYDMLASLYKAGADINFLIGGSGEPTRNMSSSEALQKAVSDVIAAVADSVPGIDKDAVSKAGVDSCKKLMAFYLDRSTMDRMAIIAAHESAVSGLSAALNKK